MIQIDVSGTLATLTSEAWTCPADLTLEARLNALRPNRRMTEAEHAGEVARTVGGAVVLIDRPSSEQLVGPEPLAPDEVTWPEDAHLEALTAPDEPTPEDPAPPDAEADVTL